MSAPSALSNPLYRRYFIASAFATLAVWMTRFLLGWLIWEATHSFFWVGVASTSLLLPSLVVTPFFGVLSDRINLRIGVIVWLIAQATITLLCWVVFHWFSEAIAPLLVMTLMYGIVAAAGSPLRLTLIPQLVTRDELPNAVGLGAMLFNSSRIVAPAVAAAALNLINASWIFILCAVLFLLAALINWRLPNVQAKEKKTSTGWQDFKQGIAYSWNAPVIRLLFLITLTNSQVGRSFIELLPALSGAFTQGNADDLAILTACAGVGSIIGGWVISKQRGSRERLILLLTLSMIGTSLLLIPLNWSWSIVVVGALIGGISGLMTVLGTGMQIVLQLQSDNDKRGRVMSLWLTIVLAGPAVGALIMGAMAEWLGLNLMLTSMIAISFLSAVWLAARSPSTS